MKASETINDSNNTKTLLVEETNVKLTDVDYELFGTLQKRLFEQIENSWHMWGTGHPMES